MPHKGAEMLFMIMERKLFSLLLIVLLINTHFAVFGYAQQFNQQQKNQINANEAINENNIDAFKINFADTIPISAEIPSSTFSCSSSSLSPEEVQKFHDLLATGFQGNSVNAGTEPVKFRDKLDNNSVVIPAIQEEGQKASEIPAVKQELPSEKIAPKEVSYLLNNYYKGGAFAFGLEINDDLRIGQCKDSGKQCYLTEGGQKIRNDGEGMVQDAVNAFDDLKTTLDSDNQGAPTGLSQADKAAIASFLGSSSETKQLTVKKTTRTKNILIQNSVKTDGFSAHNATDCSNGLCTINIYSFFDKHYNSWFSLEMVFTTVGPTLLGKAQKMFNWLGNRGLTINSPLKEIEKKFNLAMYNDDGLLKQFGGIKLSNSRAIEQKHDLQEFFSEYYANKKVLSDGGIQNTLQKWKEKDGLITKVGQDVEKREAAFNLVNQRYDYTSYLNAMSGSAKEAFEASAQASDDVIEYAQKIAKIMHTGDDKLALNFNEFWLNDSASGLRKYAVFNKETNEFVSLAESPRQWDDVLKGFKDSGNFNGLGSKFELSPGGNLRLFQIADDAVALGPPIPIADLELAIASGKYSEAGVRLANGDIIKVSPQTLEIIRNNAPAGGSVQLVKAGWDRANALELSPLDYSKKMLEYMPTRINKAEFGTGQLRSTLVEKGWVSRRNFSLLDQQLSRELSLMKAFLNPKTGATKWLAIPFGYWALKRGFGVEGLSAYQLPDTWYQVEFYTSTDPIFNDAFIDFFSNSGSDQGDLFIRLINKLPYKVLLNEALERFNIAEDVWNKYTKGEIRSKAGNLAVYTSGPNECETCGITVSSPGGENFTASFNSDQPLQSFILEDTPQKEKQNGQTIITYSHHTNIKGNSEDSQPIDLPKAIREKNTCIDKLQEALSLSPQLAKKLGSISGGALAGAESLTYFAFGPEFGMFATLAQQLIIAPKLQDCVDVQEGYYAHFLVPEQSEQKKIESGTEKATQNVSDLVKNGTDKTLELFKGGKVSEEALKPVKESIEKLTGQPTQNKILEAIVKMNGLSTGRMNGIYLFSFWSQGGTDITPTDYKTQGEKNIASADGNNVKIDYENGTISVNGKPIISSPSSQDNVRLASTNTAVPAEEIPNTITKISLPNSEELMFEMSTNSDTIVLNENVLNCLKTGVLAQTGLELKTNNLSEAFGKTLSIITDTHSNIFVQNNSIIAEGLPRKIGTQNAKVQIKLNRKTLLIADDVNDSEIGLMKSIQFKNGFILFKPETNELLIWLKHHEDGIISGNDVTDLKPILTKTTNPLTGCEETAFNLKISGNPDSPFAQSKVDAFNTSLDHFGPYQIFDTETHKYILYTDASCQERLKIINKDTGEIYDQPITSIKQTPDGFEVTTADGKNHAFDFGVDNGQPFIDYNGLREILRSAAGKNGSFYYDPNKGLFYAENAQMLPLNESFKQQGINTKTNPDGSVSSTAGGNPLNINIGTNNQSPISLPSLPENPMLLTLIMAIMIALIVFIQFRIRK